MMFIVQYFDNYKCCWDSEPNTTALITGPEKLFSGSCQQIVINFFVVVQAGFWACSPLALWAASAVTGTLHRTHPSSLPHHCLQNAVCKALRGFLPSIFTSKLENAAFLTALRRHSGPAKMRVLLSFIAITYIIIYITLFFYYTLLYIYENSSNSSKLKLFCGKKTRSQLQFSFSAKFEIIEAFSFVILLPQFF